MHKKRKTSRVCLEQSEEKRARIREAQGRATTQQVVSKAQLPQAQQLEKSNTGQLRHRQAHDDKKDECGMFREYVKICMCAANTSC